MEGLAAYNSICEPMSTTRWVGRWKNPVASAALLRSRTRLRGGRVDAPQNR